MKRLLFAALLALVPSSAFADTLIDNINGMQVGPGGDIQRFTGLLIGDDGKVKEVLSGDTRMDVNETDRRVDGGGRTLLPGLIDAHAHVMAIGVAETTLDLTGTDSLADLQQRLRDYAAAHPNDAWIVGFGWNQELWPEKRFPTAADLDAIVPDRPVVLERIDKHALVANSAAIKLAGVTAATADPVGGRIERGPDGMPNGLFVDAAEALIQNKLPPQSTSQADRALALAQQELLSSGVTGVGAMSVSQNDWETLRRAGEAGRLQVRLMAYALGKPFESVSRPTPWLYGDRLRMVGIKLFADGALGSRGAWLKEPYTDQPGTKGLQFHSDAELFSAADSASAAGFQVATHAIGDAANAQAIATYERLSTKYPGDRRWRIEHAQVINPADIPRLAQAGIIASTQPIHQVSDRTMAEARLGPQRLVGAYAWATIAKSGAQLAFGSDAPVEPVNTFLGLSAAVSRRDPEGVPPGGWRPQERLSFAQALDGFTRGAAYAGFAEDKIGSLEPGKWADFILIDRDPTQVDAQSLARTQVLETWIAGEKVWERPASSPAEPSR